MFTQVTQRGLSGVAPLRHVSRALLLQIAAARTLPSSRLMTHRCASRSWSLKSHCISAFIAQRLSTNDNQRRTDMGKYEAAPLSHAALFVALLD
jgi:aspartokinase-like uncharacterized kinase